MKLSSKIKRCQLSPFFVFDSYAEQAKAKGIHIYHLNLGQPDILTPKEYYNALREYSNPVISYPPSEGKPEIIDAVRDYYAKLGVDLKREDILITFGGSEALQMAFASILDEGDEIIAAEPHYPNYRECANLAGASLHIIPTSPETGYRYATREQIEPCINEHTRAIIVTNPGNPTGVVLTEEELLLLMEIAREHDLFLICDEVYREFVYDSERLVTALQYPEYKDRIIVVDSVSKRFSACGTRIGFLISKNAEFMSEATKWCQCRLGVSTVDQAAAAALYSVGKDYFEAVREEYKARRDTLVRGLRKIPGVVFAKPEGAFYVMAALPVDDVDKFQLFLLTEFQDHGETMMFSPGEFFYSTPGKGHTEIRMAYVLKEADLERAMEILAKALKAYNNRKV
jgi:aspartate aminotransferase